MLTTDAQERKDTPIFSGVLAYFPDALAEVARVSKAGNDQHNPGQPLHWAKEKSTDEADALVRHLLEHGTRDSDGMRHSAKVAWRALALLQRELDAEAAHAPTREELEDIFRNDASAQPDFPAIVERPRLRYVRTDKMREDEHFDAVRASVRATIEDAEEDECYTAYEAGVVNQDGCA
jgi:hypothetical protein